jgi:hypothetical protein
MAVLTLISFPRGAGLLQDTDTRVLLSVIREEPNPWRWFTGDWPLGNHFYRPISTAVFQIDNALYGEQAWGYGLTNAALAAACILLLFWVVRELTSKPWMAAAASGLFGLWQVAGGSGLGPLFLAAAFAALVGFFRRGSIWLILAAFTSAFWLSFAFGPMTSVRYQVVDWLPGRTASVMAVFCLISIASYARFERIGAPRRAPRPATATDLPPTKTTDPNEAQARPAWGWLGVSVAALLLALGSYEQAVMLPAILLGTAIWMAIERRRPRWWTQALFWGALVGYLALRTALVPSEVSGYQAQQLRDGPGVLLDISAYLFPAALQVSSLRIMAEGLPDTLLLLDQWLQPIGFVLGSLAIWGLAWRQKRFWQLLGAMLMSGVAFLPMAWLQVFGHYHYWPNAMRALYMVLAAQIVVQAVISAASPRAIQAPARPRPASGSLPHP